MAETIRPLPFRLRVRTIRLPAQQAKNSLREAAQYLHNLMESIRSSGRVVGLDRVAVMAALNISNELLQSKQQHDAEQAKVATTVQKLSDRVADTQ